MAEMGGTVERAFSIREVVNAASNVVTTAATGNIQTNKWRAGLQRRWRTRNTLSLRTRRCLNSYKC
jgi:hypothetical protein